MGGELSVDIHSEDQVNPTLQTWNHPSWTLCLYSRGQASISPKIFQLGAYDVS
jgi:hypothetical protein